MLYAGGWEEWFKKNYLAHWVTFLKVLFTLVKDVLDLFELVSCVYSLRYVLFSSLDLYNLNSLEHAWKGIRSRTD